MPTVLRQSGFDFRIYTFDHVPSHVHVWKAGKEVVINLGDGRHAPYVRSDNGMSKHEKNKALQITGEKQDFLLAEWEKIHGST